MVDAVTQQFAITQKLIIHMYDLYGMLHYCAPNPCNTDTDVDTEIQTRSTDDRSDKQQTVAVENAANVTHVDALQMYRN